LQVRSYWSVLNKIPHLVSSPKNRFLKKRGQSQYTVSSPATQLISTYPLIACMEAELPFQFEFHLKAT